MKDNYHERPYVLSVVRYGDPSTVCSLASKLQSSPTRSSTVLTVADNGPSVSAELIELKQAGVVDHLLGAEHNPGYFPSAFAAAKKALSPQTEWIIVANPDMTIDLSNLAESLIKRDSSKRIIVVPQVLEGCDPKNPHIRSRPKIRWFLTRALIHSNYSTHRMFMQLHRIRKQRTSKPRLDVGVQQMYAPHGSIAAFSRPAFDLLLPSANLAVLYSEELWMGELCLRLQIPIMNDPGWVVTHESHGSTGQLTARRRHELWRRASFRSLTLRLRKGQW